jgi:hypothetical protein
LLVPQIGVHPSDLLGAGAPQIARAPRLLKRHLAWRLGSDSLMLKKPPRRAAFKLTLINQHDI